MIKFIIVPSVKNKCGNLADKNNYRSIALSSMASKVVEHVILCRLEEYLWTNDNQFGFKPSHSTDLCVYALTKFIEYFKRRSTLIYVAFLDASKAFYKISRWTLLKKNDWQRCANIFSQDIMLLTSTSRNDCTVGFMSI